MLYSYLEYAKSDGEWFYRLSVKDGISLLVKG